ncbi:serine/threonine-protein kinase [Sinomonas mesophila]|uniref:serine/threonine-protein kinase n=1 Tax=Sinomonas mesophila TaxID=1531955 RepID=UPI000986EF3D|nr:serine/threonine-protein kinase [Sinomonas mesophila]
MAESENDHDPALLGGRYRLLEVVGRGAMATVHRASDEVLGRDVAVKTFRAHAPDPRHELRRRGEMEVLARLTHPSLVQLYDAGTDPLDDGTQRISYLVMEFVEGRDLRCVLAGGPLADDDARRLALDLAEALAYVHAQGIVHRDIKPANILVPDGGPGTGSAATSRRRAKLTDFGIARLTDAARLTITNTTIGTANYLSPEQARGEAVGPASDIYSLGLVLLECLTGTMEFTGSAVEAAVARLMRDPRMPQGLGEPWSRLLPAMTAREPGDRPSAELVAAVLRREAELPAAAGALGAGAATEVMTPAAGTSVLPARPARPPLVGAGAGAGAAASVAPEPAGTQMLHTAGSASPSAGAHAPRSRRRRPLAWATAAVLVVAALLVAVPLALQARLSNTGGTPSSPAAEQPSSPATLAPAPAPSPSAPAPSPMPSAGDDSKGKNRDAAKSKGNDDD